MLPFASTKYKEMEDAYNVILENPEGHTRAAQALARCDVPEKKLREEDVFINASARAAAGIKELSASG